MLEGMDYHYANMCKIIDAMKLKHDDQSAMALPHEAVAYLNRMGQFYYFATSKFVTDTIGSQDEHIIKIKELRPFRNKHTAHRSLDVPLKEDEENNANLPYQAMTLQGIGRVGHPRPNIEHFVLPGQPGWTLELLWKQSYLEFQMNLGNGDCRRFIPERDHPEIAQEAYEVISKVIMAKAESSDQ